MKYLIEVEDDIVVDVPEDLDEYQFVDYVNQKLEDMGLEGLTDRSWSAKEKA